MSSPRAPKKYRNKRKFYILNKDNELWPCREKWVDIEFYREIKPNKADSDGKVK